VRIISASDLEWAVDYPSLVERLRGLLRRQATSPLRLYYDLSDVGGTMPLAIRRWRGSVGYRSTADIDAPDELFGGR
jgi:hypothetical protein|tara:strand:- start:475 stop:705 length:231 start_codon:yes stop_codon:yes gene_type:complete